MDIDNFIYKKLYTAIRSKFIKEYWPDGLPEGIAANSPIVWEKKDVNDNYVSLELFRGLGTGKYDYFWKKNNSMKSAGMIVIDDMSLYKGLMYLKTTPPYKNLDSKFSVAEVRRLYAEFKNSAKEIESTGANDAPISEPIETNGINKDNFIQESRFSNDLIFESKKVVISFFQSLNEILKYDAWTKLSDGAKACFRNDSRRLETRFGHLISNVHILDGYLHLDKKNVSITVYFEEKRETHPKEIITELSMLKKYEGAKERIAHNLILFVFERVFDVLRSIGAIEVFENPSTYANRVSCGESIDKISKELREKTFRIVPEYYSTPFFFRQLMFISCERDEKSGHVYISGFRRINNSFTTHLHDDWAAENATKAD